MSDRPTVVRGGRPGPPAPNRSSSPVEIKALGRLIGAMLAREYWQAETPAGRGSADGREGASGVDGNA